MSRLRFLAFAAASLLLAPAAPAAACTADAALVMFDRGSAEIGPEGRQRLDSLAERFASSGGRSAFRLVGHTDRSGAAAANRRLSLRRAEAVRDYLAGRGIPFDRLHVHALGESRPALDTPDGAAEPQNRFVEVLEAPGEEDLARREAERRAGGPVPVC